MKVLTSSKHMYAMFIFILLFNMIDILTFLSTSNRIDMVVLLMILLPSLFVIYHINKYSESVPRTLRLLALATTTIYITYICLDITITILSFSGLNQYLYLIYNYKFLIFIASAILLVTVQALEINYQFIQKIIFCLFCLTILVITYFIISLTLSNEIVIHIVSYDANYTSLISIVFPILFLVFYKFKPEVLQESLFMSYGIYMVVILTIMLISTYVSADNNSVTFVNVAFTSFIHENTHGLITLLIFGLYIVFDLFKAMILYLIVVSSYGQGNLNKRVETLPVSLICTFMVLAFCLRFADDLWSMKQIIQTLYVSFSIILLISLSVYSTYLCFKNYMSAFNKGLILVLSTFPIAISLVYLVNVKSSVILFLSAVITKLNIVFYSFSLLVLILYILETIILLIAYRKRIYTTDLEINDDAEEMYIYVLIPCMNEELVINKTLTSLLANDYERLKIYVIDDASTDNTRYEASKCADSRKHILKRTKPNAQIGKGEALNWAYYQLLNVIDDHGLDYNDVLITIIDADTEVEVDYFEKVSKVFKARPKVTGLQSKVRVIDLGINNSQDLEFAQIINSMQALRNWTDTVAFGGNGQFCRLSTLQKLDEKPWSKSLVEDFDLSTRLYLKLGDQIHNVQYNDIYIKQTGIVNDKPALVKQRVRWAQGNVQSFKYLSQIITSRKLRLIQKLELISTLIKPWLMAIEYAILIYTLVLIVDVYIFEGLTKMLVLIIILFIAMGTFIIFINFIWALLYNLEKQQRVKVKNVIIDTFYLSRFLFTLTQIYPQSILRHLKSDNGWDKTNRQQTNQRKTI